MNTLFLVEVTAVLLQQCCQRQGMQQEPVSPLSSFWRSLRVLAVLQSNVCVAPGKEGLGANVLELEGRRRLGTETSLWINLGCGQACKLEQRVTALRGWTSGCVTGHAPSLRPSYRASKISIPQGKSALQRSCLNEVTAYRG